MTMGAEAGPLVSAETAVSVETAGASIIVSTGAEIGAGDASIELSLTRPVESVPQPPTTTPRTAKTTRTGPTREITRNCAFRSTSAAAMRVRQPVVALNEVAVVI